MTKRQIFRGRGMGSVSLLGVVAVLGGVEARAQAVETPAQTVAEPAPPPPAEAPAPAADDGAIVVTALKRATNIQETPISISAVSATALSRQGITDSQQLTKMTPNLIINEASSGGSRISIRNLYASGEPLVGLYYDEVPLTGTGGVSNDAGGTMPGLRMFDVERAEVLRGPQGTLYGASSMAGTIRVIFAKPKLSRFEGAVGGQIVDYAHGSGIGGGVDGMINVPIIKDKLALRAVGFYDRTPGYIDNSVLGLKDVNKGRGYGGRVMLRFQPTDNLTFDAMGVYQNKRGYGTTWNQTIWYLTDHKFDQNLYIQSPNNDKLRLFSGTLNWDFNFATLTAVASYTRRDLRFNFDYTPYFTRYYTGRYTGDPTGIPGYRNFVADCLGGFATGVSCDGPGYQQFITSWGNLTAYQPQSTKTWTQEVRLSNGDHALKWTVGFYHSSRKNFTESILNRVDPATGKQAYPEGAVFTSFPLSNSIALYRTIDDKLSQIAGFADVTWDISQQFSVNAGVRVFKYKKDTGAAVIIPNYIAGNVRLPRSVVSGEESGKLLKFGANYKVTPDIMLYASASQGYRPGGVNQTLGLPSYAMMYTADSVWSYELGAKTSFFDRKLILNADIFQMDWKDMQISASYQGAFGFITNSSGKARVRGFEMDSTIRPMRGLSFNLSGSYTDARLLGDQSLPNGISLCTGSPPYINCAVLSGIGRKGNSVPYSPKWTFQAAADYRQPLSDGLSLIYHGDVSYRSSAWTVYNRTITATVTRETNMLPAFHTVGLRFGLEKDEGDRWGVYLFANNLFDKTGYIAKSSTRSSSTIAPYVYNGVSYPSTMVTTIPPRVIGLSFTAKFQ